MDGEALPGEAYADSGTAYVPLAPFLEAVGGWETSWDPEARTAWAETDLFSLAAPIQNSHVLADGWLYDTGGSTVVRDGSTYVPLRSLANLLGAQVEFVDWDSPVAVFTAREAAYTEEDLYWLSRIISAESRGESLLGQMAVGSVILNRRASGKFPDTIQGVIFDRKDAVQFEPVANGTIYDEPTRQSILAARLVLSGASVVGGCMYFFNPSLSTGQWIRRNCTYYTSIGCHMFYQ